MATPKATLWLAVKAASLRANTTIKETSRMIPIKQKEPDVRAALPEEMNDVPRSRERGF